MSTASGHPGIVRQVDRLFTHGLPPERHHALRDHLRECDGCRAHYEQVRALEDALFPAEAGLNPSAVDRLTDLIVQPTQPTRRWAPWALPGLATAAAAAVLLVVAVIAPTNDAERFEARGGSLPTAGGITVLQIDPTLGSVARLARQPGGTPVSSGSVIQIAYTNSEFRYAVVVGLDARLALQWYHPSHAEESAGVPLRAHATDELFGDAWTITAPNGPLRLFALFSNRPFDPEAVRIAAQSVRGSNPSVREVTALPGIGAHQDTVLLEVGR